MPYGMNELCRHVWEGAGPGEDTNRHTCFQQTEHAGAHRCLCGTESEQNPSDGPDTPPTPEAAGEGQ